MTDEQYQAAIDEMKRYAASCLKFPERADSSHYIDFEMKDEFAIHGRAMEHVGWMLNNMPPNGNKGMRWLGFIQGVLWAMGEATIDEMRNANMKKDSAA